MSPDSREILLQPNDAQETTSLLLVCPSRLLRDHLAAALGERFPRRHVLAAADTASALHVLGERRVSLVLLDVSFTDAGCAREFQQRLGEILIVGFTTCRGDVDVLNFARAGVRGFIPHDASLDELMQSIARAERGEWLCPPALAALLVRQIGSMSRTATARIEHHGLTAREVEILRLIDGGLPNKAIANRLGIELSTVKNHVHNILDKLDVPSRVEAAARMRTRLPDRRFARASAPGSSSLSNTP